MLNELPLSAVAATLTTMVVAIFFITSSDSGSLVMDILSSGGRTDTPPVQKTFWALLVGAVAAILLLVGGLAALQTAAITTALPFTVIMLLICAGLFRALRAERTTHDPFEKLWSGVRRLPGSAALGVLAVPAAASTLAGAFGSGRPKYLQARAKANEPTDWRDRLRRITAEPEPSYRQQVTGVDEAQQVLQEFFEQTVVPAFELLKSELETQGRSVTVTQGANMVQLEVLVDGAEEFRYGIEGHARADVAFAFPKFDLQRRPVRATAEVVLRSGKKIEHEVHSFNQERIINDFLQAYAKWMGW